MPKTVTPSSFASIIDEIAQPPSLATWPALAHWPFTVTIEQFHRAIVLILASECAEAQARVEAGMPHGESTAIMIREIDARSRALVTRLVCRHMNDQCGQELKEFLVANAFENLTLHLRGELPVLMPDGRELRPLDHSAMLAAKNAHPDSNYPIENDWLDPASSVLHVEMANQIRIRDESDPYTLIKEFDKFRDGRLAVKFGYANFKHYVETNRPDLLEQRNPDSVAAGLGLPGPCAPPEAKDTPAPTETKKRTLTNTEAAKTYQNEVRRSITLDGAKSRISKMCRQRDGFSTTGRDGKPRISEESLAALILEDNTRDIKPRGRNASDDDLYDIG